ncbi:TetR/AcrR family transcriptional regulator [Paenibacillus ginsengarvi]|uniref:TetR family transcriptional regulator n=1 Tax=Paenibacillus ginsengarvi TaxID=400777 RepID=A0A3B0AR16_9BACL|nr:TetR family transcriptional regulator [Paenibacillus ginsengarvi]RKN62893.1 TetR family transcriptional regulator [Paenibacillus ginsengarvi]
MRRSKEEALATIGHLLEVARKHFTERGYADSSMEEIVAEANLTRGALYHHFGSKKGLFQAVLESVQAEIGERVEAEAIQSDDAWEQLIAGCRAFVAAAVEPRNRRILLVDGPAVLGWEAWRRMDEENSMRHLREQLGLMQLQGVLKPVPLDAMTHFLSGALNESVLWIAQSEDDARPLEETMTVISHFMKGFANE